jgi:hypothetical protein
VRILACLSIVILMAIFLSPSLSATPTISWSNTAVSKTLLQGTLDSSSINFVTTQDLQNVDVTVVPALAALLIASPSHFDRITKGSTYQVKLLFSIPATTLSGTYSGTIKLSSRTTPPRGFAVPLSVSITYNNQRPLSSLQISPCQVLTGLWV